MFCNGASTPTMAMPDCKRLHDQRAKNGAIDRADPARQRGAADHGRRDHAQLVQRADVVGTECQARRGDDRRDGAQQRPSGQRS